MKKKIIITILIILIIIDIILRVQPKEVHICPPPETIVETQTIEVEKIIVPEMEIVREERSIPNTAEQANQ